MNDENINALTERVAANVLRLQNDEPVDLRLFGMDVIKVCQAAQAGASPRPVQCVLHFKGALAEVQPSKTLGVLSPTFSTEGVGFDVIATGPGFEGDGDLLAVSLGVEGALHMAGELQANAVQSGTLAARARAH